MYKRSCFLFSIDKFIREVSAEVQKNEFIEQRWDQQHQAEEARKARKKTVNKILQSGGMFHADEARSMIAERLELENQRAGNKKAAFKKRYDKALNIG